MDKTKIEYFLNNYPLVFGRYDDQTRFYLGNCYVQLGDYIEAQRQYERSFLAMFGPRKDWKGTGKVDWLVDTCVLSGREDLYPDVARELELYKKLSSKGGSAMAFYAYGLMEYLLPSGWDISVSIKGLIRRPTWKLTFAIGHVIQSIMDQDTPALRDTLLNLLKVHEGMAKHGALRETPEGLICMQAMSLAYVARKRGMKIDIENEYLSLGYLDFLVERPG